MNPHTLRVLEFEKILQRVAAHCSFSGGADLARSLLPSDDLRTVQDALAQTQEAFLLLEQHSDIHFGGVSDVRPLVEKAERLAGLLPGEMLEIKNTLLRARSLLRSLTRVQQGFPRLADLASVIEPCDHVIAEIARCISDRGEVLSSASSALGQIRGQLRVAQDRLMSTLERYVQSDSLRSYLQEPIVTQRQGRYVVPVRAEYKGYVDGIVHDQSASGATFFVEPIKVVEQNNAVRELELAEEKEIRRILAELTELVSEEGVYIRRNVQVLAELDFTFGKAKYAYQLDATAPQMVAFQPQKPPLHSRLREVENGRLPEEPPLHPGSFIDLKRARHPLLDPQSVVPIDVQLGQGVKIGEKVGAYLLIITGPNTGGKTVSLKTVGLLAVMAQSGLMLPVDQGSSLSVFSGIYGDIGDEQSIEQSLSTFSSHMTRIISILEEADPQSLVILDELGAGTDPEEGSALAMALLENLRDRGITTLATTHYSELKLYAHNTPGVCNASMEFDVESLSPTYELSIGLPGRSNALTIARRLGLTPVIVDMAEGSVRPDALAADALLDDIKRARQVAAQAESHARDREQQAVLLETDLRYQLAQMEEVRRRVIAETRTVMQRELEEAQREIANARRQLARSGGESVDSHESFLSKAQEVLDRRALATAAKFPERVAAINRASASSAAIEVGDRVWVASLQASGEVTTIHHLSVEAEVQVGNFRLKLPLERLELREKATIETLQHPVQVDRAHSDSPGMELDLRGERVETGLGRLDRYLDDAYLSQLPWVRIIHGKGTGAMRDAVREVLRSHPLVNGHRAGEMNEGGDGVTVAKLIGS